MFRTAFMIAAATAAISASGAASATAFGSGPIALETLTLFAPDIIVTDDVLPADDIAAFRAKAKIGNDWWSPDDRLPVGTSDAVDYVYSGSFKQPGAYFRYRKTDATAMPEPMSWAMMVVGLSAMGWLLRKRQKQLRLRVSFV